MQTVWAELSDLASSEQGFESDPAKGGEHLVFSIPPGTKHEVADGDTFACGQISVLVSDIWLSPSLRLVYSS